MGTGATTNKSGRTLSPEETALMAEVDDLRAVTGEWIKQLEQNPLVDKRWLAIAKTDLQKGFMDLTRAIAKPDVF